MNRTKYWLLGYIAAFVACLFVFPLTTKVLALAFILSLIINAPAKYFSKRLSKGAISIISAIVLWGAFAFLIYNAIPIIIDGIKTVTRELNTFISSDTPEEAFGKIKLPAFIEEALRESGQDIGAYINDLLIRVGGYLSSNIAGWITSIVLLIVAASFIAQKLPLKKGLITLLFPSCDEGKLKKFFKEVYSDLETYVGGQLIIAVIVGVIVGVGAALIGTQYAVFLGLLAGVTNLIPFLGVVITAVPMMLLAYSNNGLWGVLGAVIVLVLANQLETWVLSPRIVANRVNINWFIILVTLIAFGELFGPFGIVLAVPSLIFLRRFWIEFVLKRS